MVHIKITKGLDIPISGKPQEGLQSLAPSAEVALNLGVFDFVKFRLLVKVGDSVKIGQPLAEDKGSPGRMFVSPAGGVVKLIQRGLKRRLLGIVIGIDAQEKHEEYGPFDVTRASREDLTTRLKAGGLFAHIRARPFNLLANPHHVPRAIFVKALESAPFAPSAEMQIEGLESEFQIGLTALSKLTSGQVHLVYRAGSACKAFTDAKDVQGHTAEGPHPIANSSIHIHYIDPIKRSEDTVWTVTACDVACIGKFLKTGHYPVQRVVSIAGTGLLPDKRGFFKARLGCSIRDLVTQRLTPTLLRLISGDVLTGTKVEIGDFLGFFDQTVSVIPENTQREFLHFFRPGLDKFTATKAYLSGHMKKGLKEFEFSTNLHGEERAFIDGLVYDRVMPMRIPTMQLVKAVLAGDFDTAELLGFLEVDSEDFALPTFICPSKIEMSEIIKDGLRQYAKEVLH